MKVGSLVTPIYCQDGIWYENSKIEKSHPGPKNGDICTVTFIGNCTCGCGEIAINLAEWPNNKNFVASEFAELQPPMDVCIEEIMSQPATP